VAAYLAGVISVRLLGPFELTVRQRPVAITRRRERWLLAILALEANRVVPIGRLVELLWVDEPPAAASRMVQSHVSRIRSVLGRAARGASVDVVFHERGYALQIDPQCVDVHRFRQLLEHSATTSGPARAALLESALDLWRGEFLQGVDDVVRNRLGAGLQAQRLAAIQDWAATQLGLGRTSEVIGRLAELAEQEPLPEHLVELHMLALHEAGRTLDALALYETTRARLVEYGLDPGQALKEARLAILRDDAGRLIRSAPQPPGPPPPAQLPRPATNFVGRDRELDQIAEVLTDKGSGVGPVVVAIHGQGGAGKSALAIAAAHRVVAGFPDGQLYIDLQGGTKVLPPVAAADALGRLLRTLGVAAAPVDVAESAALLRTLLARRRMLIVADNAAGVDQVLPLLPGSPGSAVIVTSRPVLTTLDSALQIGLGPLSHEGGQELLRLASGRRTTDEGAAVAEVAAACGYLPLVLRVAGARMMARPDWSFADLARRLAGERNLLRELQDRDDTVAGSLRVTIRGLKESPARVDVLAAQLLTALGALDVPDVDPELAAALVSVTPAQAELALDRLVEARLLNGREGRYRPHDLVRKFISAEAAEMAPAARHEIVEAALRWYLNSAVAVNKLMYGTTYAQRLEGGGTPSANLPDATTAGRWLDAERANLLAIGQQGLTAHPQARSLAGSLVDALYPSLISRSLAFTWEQLCRTVLAMVDPRENPKATYRALRGLAVMYRSQLRLDEALEQLDQALALKEIVEDPISAAGLLEIRGTVYVSRNEPDKAFPDLEDAVRICREGGQADALAVGLSNLAEAHFKFGRPERAVECLTESLELRRQRGNASGEAITLGNLAVVYAKIAQPEEALRWADEAIARSQDSGERVNECRARIERSRLLVRLDRPREALDECRLAMRLAEETGSISDNVLASDLVDVLRSIGPGHYAALAEERLRRIGAMPAGESSPQPVNP
jgi:DNA-binding SARP family transcriptional activator/tetratricopeptide (TPR) repeat protein